jgi:hypothetical protein
MYLAFSLAWVGLLGWGSISYLLMLYVVFFFCFQMIDRPTYVLYVFPPLSFFLKKWAWLSCNAVHLVSSSLEMASTWLQCSSLDHSQIITGSSLDINSVDVTPFVERSQVTTCICALLHWPDMRRGLCAFIPDIWVVIHYGRVKSYSSSHQLYLVTWLKLLDFFLIIGLLLPITLVQITLIFYFLFRNQSVLNNKLSSMIYLSSNGLSGPKWTLWSQKDVKLLTINRIYK